jgi:hypothetical protein
VEESGLKWSEELNPTTTSMILPAGQSSGDGNGIARLILTQV